MVKLVEMGEGFIKQLDMPEGSSQVQAWIGLGFNVLKSIDDVCGIQTLHVSVNGLSQTAAFDVVSFMYPTLAFECDPSKKQSRNNTFLVH